MAQNRDAKIGSLWSLFDQEIETFHDIDIPDRTYAQVNIGNATEVLPLEGRKFRRFIMDRARQKFGCRYGEDEVRTVAKEAAARAQFRGKGYKLATRIGECDGYTYVDLADKSRRAVKLTPAGNQPWEVVQSCPVKFLRPAGMLALPEPVHGGDINELKKFLNLDGQDPHPWILTVSWMLATMRPKGPYPALFMNGEQGTAKSTMSRVVKMMVDPNKAPIRSAPHNERDLLISTTNSWLLAFDNLSVLPEDLSDCICRLASGGGFSTRALYTDSDEQIFYAMRPVVFNGIEEIVLRSDLLDRMVWITLPTIPDDCRKTEKDFWTRFEEAWPRLLGALLEVVSRAERDFDSVQTSNLPRMADFARFSIAAESHLGLAPGAFMKAYEANRKNADELVIEASTVGTTIRKLMEKREKWDGTSTTMLDELNSQNSNAVAQFSWPRTPRKLSGMLRRITPNLRRLGIEVEFQERTGEARPIAILNRHFKPAVIQRESDANHDDPELTRLMLGVTAANSDDGDDDEEASVSSTPTPQVVGVEDPATSGNRDFAKDHPGLARPDVNLPVSHDGSDGVDGHHHKSARSFAEAPELHPQRMKGRAVKV